MGSNLLAFELNPVLRREVRARWRKWPTFAIVFGYAILLALAIGWMFLEVVSGSAAQGASKRTAMLGFQLFEKVSWLQLLGWMVLSPVLAAPAIAGEREQGLMDGLYLSSLTPREILRGKLQSMLWFIGLMLLVPLPVIAICFQMGGVSPHEFLLTMSLNATTALTGTALGLHASAHASTTGAALRATFYYLGLWLAASLLCCCVGLIVSPIPAMFMVLNGDDSMRSVGLVGFTMLCQFAITGRLLQLAQKALLRPLPEVEISTAGVIAPATPAYQVPLKEVASMATAPTQRTASNQSRRYGENYFFSRLRSRNPILQFELSRRLRIRSPIAADLYNAVMMLGICFSLWLSSLLILASHTQASFQEIWKLSASIWLIVGVVAGAVMGATTFARDREQLMLEPILLSPLTNMALILAKLGAILTVCLAHSLLLLPVMAPCIRSVANISFAAKGISLVQAVLTCAIIVLAMVCGTLFGMSVSWLCRRTFVATGWTLALFFLLSAWNTLLFPPTGPLAQDAYSHWHPFYAMILVAGNGRPWRSQLLPGITCIVVLAVVSALLLAFLLWAMRDRGRIRDRAWRWASKDTSQLRTV